MTPASALSNPSDPLLVGVVAIVALILMVLSRFARRWVPTYEEPGQDTIDRHKVEDRKEASDAGLKEWFEEQPFSKEDDHRIGADSWPH